jgi:rod shape-determining protein MreC
MAAERRRRRTLVGVLVLVSLVLITLDFRQGDDGPLSTAQQLAMAAFSPVQDAVGSVVRPIGGFFSNIGQLGRLREENAALEAELDALRSRAVAIADLERENDALRDALRMSRRLELTTSAARVIGQPPGAFRWSVLIDIGSDNGVQRNMAVVNAEGFVGKVTDVTATHARVQLAASPNAGYAVRIADSGQQGLVSGRGSRPLEMFIIDDPEADIPVGSEVVTRAFQGGSIPDGIPLGLVEQRGEEGTERAQFLDVVPHVDFSRLDIVLVVLDAPIMPVDLEPEEADEDELDLPEDLEDIEAAEPGSDDGAEVGAATDRRRRATAAAT